MRSVIDNERGGVLLVFSRVKSRPSWHQQEFTRENVFRVRPSHPGYVCLVGVVGRSRYVVPRKVIAAHFRITLHVG